MALAMAVSDDAPEVRCMRVLLDLNGGLGRAFGFRTRHGEGGCW